MEGKTCDSWFVFCHDTSVKNLPGIGTHWWCQCHCGKCDGEIRSIVGAVLRHRNVKCLARGGKSRHGHARGKTVSRTYKSWWSMHQRCSNPNMSSYSHYGGRNISVCTRWSSFVNFLSDMGERPEGTTLDRVNGSGNYTPENCRWSTPKDQANNRKQGGSRETSLKAWETRRRRYGAKGRR